MADELPKNNGPQVDEAPVIHILRQEIARLEQENRDLRRMPNASLKLGSVVAVAVTLSVVVGLWVNGSFKSQYHPSGGYNNTVSTETDIISNVAVLEKKEHELKTRIDSLKLDSERVASVTDSLVRYNTMLASTNIQLKSSNSLMLGQRIKSLDEYRKLLSQYARASDMDAFTATAVDPAIPLFPLDSLISRNKDSTKRKPEYKAMRP